MITFFCSWLLREIILSGGGLEGRQVTGMCISCVDKGVDESAFFPSGLCCLVSRSHHSNPSFLLAFCLDPHALCGAQFCAVATGMAAWQCGWTAPASQAGGSLLSPWTPLWAERVQCSGAHTCTISFIGALHGVLLLSACFGPCLPSPADGFPVEAALRLCKQP